MLLTTEATCTVTLVGCHTAATAGHCVCSATGTGTPCAGGGAVFDPADTVVLVPHAGFLRVGAIHLAPNYEFGVSGDIALLDFDFPVRGIRPRAINEVARPAFGTSATLLGFGRTTEGSANAGLLRSGAALTAPCSGVSNTTHVCWNFLHPLGPPGTESNICPGDSGGPLLADLGAGLALVGVHSGGVGGNCEADGSAFDTDVFVQRSWLRSQAGSDLDQARCGDGAQIGEPGATAASLTGTVSSAVSRSFVVQPGTKVLRVGLSSELTGDVDLYVRAGAPATTTVFTCSSAFQGSFEYCEVGDPTPGTWYALVVLAGGTASGYQLTATQLPEDPAPPPAAPGDVFVANFASFETLQVDLATGERATQSSSLAGAGAPLTNVEGIALDADGTLLAANPTARNLLRIDPATGDRSIVSGCVDANCTSALGAGPAFLQPRFVARARDGSLLVTDRSTPGIYAVVRVDPATGARTLVSGCTSEACSAVVGLGPPIGRLFGIATLIDDSIIVADGVAVFVIDPDTGNRAILSGCVDAACTAQIGSGPAFGQPSDVAIDASGAILATYQIEGSTFGALRRIDPATGARTLVTGCQDLACTSVLGAGPTFVNPFGLAIDADESLLVTDTVLDALLRVDPVSGDRTLLSGCGDVACSVALGGGPQFAEPIDVAVVPEPGRLASGLAASAVLAVRRRARRATRDGSGRTPSRRA